MQPHIGRVLLQAIKGHISIMQSMTCWPLEISVLGEDEKVPYGKSLDITQRAARRSLST